MSLKIGTRVRRYRGGITIRTENWEWLILTEMRAFVENDGKARFTA